MLKVVVASNVHDDELSVEIWNNNDMVGEIRKLDGRLVINLYGCPSSDFWELDLGEFGRIFKVAVEEAQTI